jgi:hypothetical protein
MRALLACLAVLLLAPAAAGAAPLSLPALGDEFPTGLRWAPTAAARSSRAAASTIRRRR